jgi:hypothetical protein
VPKVVLLDCPGVLAVVCELVAAGMPQHVTVNKEAEITSNTYNDYMFKRAFIVVPVQALVAQFIGTFKEFPPRQKPASFNVDQIMEQLQKPQSN